jgi:hypothetical protein
MAKKKTTRRKTTRKKTTTKKVRSRRTAPAAARSRTTKRTTKKSRGRSKLAGMSLDALQDELNRRLQDLREERETLKRDLDRVDAQINAIAASGARGMGITATGRPRKRPQNAANLVESLAKLLRTRTMSVTEMSGAVQKAGYLTTSPNFRTIVNQTLINHPKRFKRVSRGKYTAK